MTTEILSIKELRFLNNGPYSFSVFAGDSIGLMGQSGIGKTQLFKAIVDLIPFEGTVSCCGIEHSEIAAPKWRSMVTLVLSESFWWYDTVGEHFSEAASGADAFADAAQKLGFTPAVFDWKVANLSSGERQRLSLLRSLQGKPAVLLLDEPTSNLDQHHTGLVEEYIQNYCRKNSLPFIWISHDEAQIERIATRTFRMQNSSLIETTCP